MSENRREGIMRRPGKRRQARLKGKGDYSSSPPSTNRSRVPLATREMTPRFSYCAEASGRSKVSDGLVPSCSKEMVKDENPD